MIELAKPAMDVGLYTNNRESMLTFWREQAQLPYSELLPVGGGVQQHRHAIGESVLKINHCRETLSYAPASGIRMLTIANRVLDPNATDQQIQTLLDPDGNRVRLVVPGTEGITQLCIDLTVSSLESHRRFYGEVLGFPEKAKDTFACGVSQLRLTEGITHSDPLQRAPGFRYLTIQVFDVKSSHASILHAGGREGMAPRKLGEVAHISFVRDPDGNWIEISQRKSITGSLD